MGVLGADVGGASIAHAQETAATRRIEIRYTPTGRAQVAVWIESADGSLVRTLRLTDAVAYRGIGNRPGALQMNSGFHWPYGRREGVLPVWAHRRHEVEGDLFPRVIFNGRASEGNASSAGSAGEPTNTPDNYFCLSFQRDRSSRDQLDAVSCASLFMSNKGRYLTAEDAADNYAEPFEEGGTSGMRPLEEGSLYPPRRDIEACLDGTRCADHENVGTFGRDALAVFPELDAVTAATAPAGVEQLIVYELPSTWPDGTYHVRVEVNVEGDYAPGWDEETRPTPEQPASMWDYWAIAFGYAYRGQPSVVYDLPVIVNSAGGDFSSRDPIGYGALEGDDGEVHAMDATIRDDPSTHPGSGADRLRVRADGGRLSAHVPTTDVCALPTAPSDCGRECGPTAGACATPLVCSPDGTCVGMCEVPNQPGAIGALLAEPYREQRHQHQWGTLSFTVPTLPRPLQSWDVRVSTRPIDSDGAFATARPAKGASLDDISLVVPTRREDGSTLEPGDVISVDFGGLDPTTQYFIGVRAFDVCNSPSPIATTGFETQEIHFTTVSPCFVATAAYGSPLAPRIATLRQFRDDTLRGTLVGDAFIEAYEQVGPALAATLREHPSLVPPVRAVLDAVVTLLED